MSEGPKKIFFRPPPPPLLSQGLDDRPPPLILNIFQISQTSQQNLQT